MKHKEAIIKLASYIQQDFKLTYPEDDKEYKNHLYKALKGFDHDDIFEAYEAYSNESEPSPGDLARLVIGLLNNRETDSEEREPITVTESKPADETNRGDPVAILKEALDKAGIGIEMVRAAHSALMQRQLAAGKIKLPTEDVERTMEHRCYEHTCFEKGTQTSSVSGSEHWYCSKHIRGN